MLSLSKQTDYALLALTSLARREAEIALGLDITAAIPAKDIAEEYGIPIEFLAKVLSKLSKAQLISATFGPTGGYKLAKPATNISVGDVIGIVEGTLALTQCMKIDDNGCEQSSRCSIRGPLTRINEEILRMLSRLTIDQITERPAIVEPQVMQIELNYRHVAQSKSLMASLTDIVSVS
jgi:Rrf2 family protein